MHSTALKTGDVNLDLQRQVMLVRFLPCNCFSSFHKRWFLETSQKSSPLSKGQMGLGSTFLKWTVSTSIIWNFFVRKISPLFSYMVAHVFISIRTHAGLLYTSSIVGTILFTFFAQIIPILSLKASSIWLLCLLHMAQFFCFMKTLLCSGVTRIPSIFKCPFHL